MAYSIKESLRRKPRLVAPEDTYPATMRAPFASGEFYASWPQLATAEELNAFKRMFVAAMDGWIVAADYREVQQTAADLEYESWFEGNRNV